MRFLIFIALAAWLGSASANIVDLPPLVFEDLPPTNWSLVPMGYNCGEAAAAANLIGSAIAIFNPLSSPLEQVVNVFGFLGNLFGFASNEPSLCDIDAKLDQILVKLDDIAKSVNNLESVIKCEFIKQQYRQVTDKMDHLVRLFRAFYRTSYRPQARSAIARVCDDPSEGIVKIYSMFQSVMKRQDIINNIKNCGRYESSFLNDWASSIKQMGLVFNFLLGGCAEAAGARTEFDMVNFARTIDSSINYYTTHIVRDEFIKDTSAIGMKAKGKEAANWGKTAWETQQFFEKTYSYFYWDVIFYSDKLLGFDRHTYQPWGHHYCSSHFYMRELNNGRNAVVAYCVKEGFTQTLTLNPSMNKNHASQTNDEVLKANQQKPIQYVMTMINTWVDSTHYSTYRQYGNTHIFASQAAPWPYIPAREPQFNDLSFFLIPNSN